MTSVKMSVAGVLCEGFIISFLILDIALNALRWNLSDAMLFRV